MAGRQGHRPPYWVASRLITSARQDWARFDGWAAAQGVDPIDLPMDRFCNLVYYWLTRGADPRRRDEIDRTLERPPAGATATLDDSGSPWSAESELSAFSTAAAAASRP